MPCPGEQGPGDKTDTGVGMGKVAWALTQWPSFPLARLVSGQEVLTWDPGGCSLRNQVIPTSQPGQQLVGGERVEPALNSGLVPPCRGFASGSGAASSGAWDP